MFRSGRRDGHSIPRRLDIAFVFGCKLLLSRILGKEYCSPSSGRRLFIEFALILLSMRCRPTHELLYSAYKDLLSSSRPVLVPALHSCRRPASCALRVMCHNSSGRSS